MRDWIIKMSLQTTLHGQSLYILNQTSCHSPQFQICTVTPVSQSHILTYWRSRDCRLVYFRMGTFCDVGVARGRVSCFGHGAVVVCDSPGATIQSMRARQRNHRVLQKKTREKKKCQLNVAYLYALRKGGHTFPFNDRPWLKAWIVVIHKGEGKWQPSKHSVVCRAHFSDDDYSTLTYDGIWAPT